MEKFKVGDTVFVRSWDEMEQEFGADADGTILTIARFPIGMREFCGEEAEITYKNGSEVCLKFSNKWLNDMRMMWTFDTGMITHVNNKVYDMPDEGELMDFIGI